MVVGGGTGCCSVTTVTEGWFSVFVSTEGCSVVGGRVGCRGDILGPHRRQNSRSTCPKDPDPLQIQDVGLTQNLQERRRQYPCDRDQEESL